MMSPLFWMEVTPLEWVDDVVGCCRAASGLQKLRLGCRPTQHMSERTLNAIGHRSDRTLLKNHQIVVVVVDDDDNEDEKSRMKQHSLIPLKKWGQ